MSDEDKLTGKNLLEDGMWSSKSMWKAISSVAVGVFVVTMIYAQFQQMAKEQLHTNEKNEKLEEEVDILQKRMRELEINYTMLKKDVDANTEDSHKIGQKTK